MIELNPNDYSLVEFMFTGKKQYIPALSVIHGDFPGRVFVNRIHEPNLAVVWATSRWMYLEGIVLSVEDKQLLKNYIERVVVPDYKIRNANWFEIYTADVGLWDELFLNEFLHSLKADKHYESVYTFNSDKFADGLRARQAPLDVLTIHLNQYAVLPEEYHSLPYIQQKFKNLTTPGVEICINNKVITVCRSNGFLYQNEYFIDVDTFDEQYRHKGYASLTAFELIDHLLKEGKVPLWETTHQNSPSHHLALKLGFEVHDSYPVYAFMIR